MALDPDRRVLAGEFVLGTLAAAERREAEDLLAKDDEFRREVWFWERKLGPLGLRVKPVRPSPVLWLGIVRRIHAATPAPLRQPRVRAVTIWAVLATAASVLLSTAMLLQMTRPIPAPQIITKRVEVPVPAPTYVALLQFPESKMQWSVSAIPSRRELVVRVVGEQPQAISGKDPELWLIADGKPISLGVMPKSGEVSRQIPAGLDFIPGGVLAVSIEPLGGSPTGQPTGPVVTTTAIFQAG
jgi:anti-sigma-K factor RskA